MNCPYCGEEMEKGLIESSEPINFLKAENPVPMVSGMGDRTDHEGMQCDRAGSKGGGEWLENTARRM